MSYSYTTYQYPQSPIINTAQQPRTIMVESPTSAGFSRRATVRTTAPVNTIPQYSTNVPISSGVTRSPTQVRPQRTQFAPLPPVPPLRDVPVVTRNGSRSRRSNSLSFSRQANADDYDPYPSRSSTIKYGRQSIGSQAPYDSYDYAPSSSRRATSAPPRHPLRSVKELEDFNVGSATSAGRLFDEPHLPLPYRDYPAGSRDTRRKVPRAEAYGSSSKGGSASGHKGGGMFSWLVGHK